MSYTTPLNLKMINSDKLIFETTKRLFEELWFQSNDCTRPIENMWFSIQEVAKSTGNSREEIRRYLSILIEKGLIRITSKEPLLYEFTEDGKRVKNDLDIEEVTKNFD